MRNVRKSPKSQLAQPQPLDIPAPAFTVGVAMRWKSMSSSDWGLVMGMRYLWAKHKREFEWQYYVVLDSDSPSRQWTQFDWGWQDDLEALPLPNSEQSADIEEVTNDQ